MKHQQSLHLLPLLLLILSVHIVIAIAAKQGGDDVSVDEFAAESVFMAPEDSSNLFMGFEDCDEEECMKRRMMSEAHLDYIYTQNKKP